MVVRAAKPASASGELTFPDAAAIDDRARKDVITAVKGGIVDGCQRPTSGGCPTFRPQGHVTRAEAVVAERRK